MKPPKIGARNSHPGTSTLLLCTQMIITDPSETDQSLIHTAPITSTRQMLDASPVPRLLRSSHLSPIRSIRAGNPERKWLHSSLSRRSSDVRVLRRLACACFSFCSYCYVDRWSIELPLNCTWISDLIPSLWSGDHNDLVVQSTTIRVKLISKVSTQVKYYVSRSYYTKRTLDRITFP